MFPERGLICGAICSCDAIGQKQWCVSKALWAVDAAQDFKSTVKAEVPYDMSKRPPLPYMSKNDPWRATRGRPAGSRIPDVVVVKDGGRPPTQDNINQVVEIKFPPDVYGEGQEAAYTKIAGSKSKLVTLSPRECGCEKKRQPVTQPAPQPSTQDERSKDKAKKVAVGAGVLAGVVAAASALAAALEAVGPFLPALAF
jgi:type VI secretion system secreted protein VgrG